MGLLQLNYRRPEYVDKEHFRRSNSFLLENEGSDSSLKSGSSNSSRGIPDALTFDKIISGGTCPPCTIRDFMNYLLYVEHAAENLQFFLWYRGYVERFNNAKTADTRLSPEWTQAMEDETTAKIQKDALEKMKRGPKVAISIFKDTDFEKGAMDVVVKNRSPFSTPPSTPSVNDASSYLSGSQDAFTAAGTIQPFTIQPFRAEINRVIATYMTPTAPRQLNLSSREQKAAVIALSHTTHPSALRSIARAVEHTLRRQAHPNFIRWSVCNGNRARVYFARGLGVSIIALSTIAACVLVLSSASKGWRAICAVGWVLGGATLWAAWKGLCVVLHGLHRRHVRPWELFEDVAAEGITSSSVAWLSEGSSTELEEGRGRDGGRSASASLDSFSSSSNSYEDEPWVARYERRNVIRKVFDREVWIREPALRRVQDVIFVQSILVGFVGAGVLTAIFVVIPAGGFF